MKKIKTLHLDNQGNYKFITVKNYQELLDVYEKFIPEFSDELVISTKSKIENVGLHLLDFSDVEMIQMSLFDYNLKTDSDLIGFFNNFNIKITNHEGLDESENIDMFFNDVDWFLVSVDRAVSMIEKCIFSGDMTRDQRVFVEKLLENNNG